MGKALLEKEFLALVNEHRGILHKVCRMYQWHKDAREDLFQEILLQLWRAYPSFRADSKASTWMYRIALNTAISGIRKDKRRLPLQETETLPEVADSSPSGLERQERRELLLKAIFSLSKVEKALMLLYLEGYSYEEMAELLGISLSNTGVKISRIKKKLKELLKPHLT